MSIRDLSSPSDGAPRSSWDTAVDQTARAVLGSTGHPLSTFDGATNDDKLTAAMSYAGAQTYPPPIRLEAGTYSFPTQRTPYNGFTLIGAEGMGNAEKGTGTYQRTRVSTAVGSNNAWLQPTGSELWNMTIRNIAFVGNSATTWLGGGSTVLWACNLRDCSWSAYRTILGNQATKLLLNLSLLDGWLSFNNSYNGGIHAGGSDNSLFMGMTNIDSGAAFASAGSANGQYHVWLDYMEKTYLGPFYLTAEGAWNGLRVDGQSNPATSTGSNMGGPLWVHGAKIEGRNAGAPCNGNLVRVNGGGLELYNCWTGYAMASPTTPGHSPQDAGYVHQAGGYFLADGIGVDRATGVAETVPWFYQSAGEAYLNRITRYSKGGAWSGRPRYTSAGGTTTADATVTAI